MIASPQINPADLSLKQLIRRRRYLLLAVLSGAVMAILTFSVLIPQFQQISSIRSRVNTEQQKLDQLNNKVQFLTTFDLNTFKQQHTNLNLILPSAKPFLQLLFSLKQLASDQGVVFSGLDWNVGLVASESATSVPLVGTQPSATAGNAGSSEALLKMPLQLKVLGTTESLNTYFDEMTRMTPVVEIDTVDLVPRFQIQEGLYEASLKLSAYYAPLLSLYGAISGDKLLPKLTQDETDYIGKLGNYHLYIENVSETGGPTPSVQRENPFSL